MSYYFSKTLPVGFDEAVRRATEVLKKEGFGIITEIDVKQTLKAKIGVDFRELSNTWSMQSKTRVRGAPAGGQDRHYASVQCRGPGNRQ